MAGPSEVAAVGGDNSRSPHRRVKDVYRAWHQSWLQRLTYDVEACLATCAPSTGSLARIQRCIDELSVLVSHLGTGWSVRPFGSAANGFATTASDLDVTCLDSDAVSASIPHEVIVSTLKNEIVHLFAAHPSFQIKEEITSAMVPIVKLVFEGQLDVDLSCYNQKPLSNTRLLKAYSSFDDKVGKLVVLIKLWAKAANVCGAERSNLSSYTFTLMVIYFLQVHPDTKLPLLLPSDFEHCMDEHGPTVDGTTQPWGCSVPLAALLLDFFRFYTADFLWGNEVVSVRLGVRLTAQDREFSSLRARGRSQLHVEDPCQPERNLRCVMGDEQERHLRVALRGALDLLRAGRSPVGLQSPFHASVDRQSTAADATEAHGFNEVAKMTLPHLLRSTKSRSMCETGAKEQDPKQHLLVPPSAGRRAMCLATSKIANRVAAACKDQSASPNLA